METLTEQFHRPYGRFELFRLRNTLNYHWRPTSHFTSSSSKWAQPLFLSPQFDLGLHWLDCQTPKSGPNLKMAFVLYRYSDWGNYDYFKVILIYTTDKYRIFDFTFKKTNIKDKYKVSIEKYAGLTDMSSYFIFQY